MTYGGLKNARRRRFLESQRKAEARGRPKHHVLVRADGSRCVIWTRA